MEAASFYEEDLLVPDLAGSGTHSYLRAKEFTEQSRIYPAACGGMMFKNYPPVGGDDLA